MDRHAAERYHVRRLRQLDERRARLEEWDHAARIWSDDELAGDVPVGWRQLVLTLHSDLLALDPSYRLFAVGEELGGLEVKACFAESTRALAARRVHIACAEALTTCQVCAAPAVLRPERTHMKTLCDDCFDADRAAAAARGEQYADVVLDFLQSPDDDYPTPDETLAWLDALDGD